MTGFLCLLCLLLTGLGNPGWRALVDGRKGSQHGLAMFVKERKETLGFTSTETIKRLIRDGEVGGSGIFFISNTYSLHCHPQNDSALRWAVV